MKAVLDKLKEWEEEIISIELQMIENKLSNLPEYLRLVSKRNEYRELVNKTVKMLDNYEYTRED